MTLDRLQDDLKSSLKSGRTDRVGVLRLLLSELQNRAKEKFAKSGSGVLEEAEVMAVFQKEAKKRKEATELFRKGEREDLVTKEEGELRIIAEYLPQPMSRDEVVAHIEKLMSGGLRDFNPLMREAMKELKGKVDGQVLADMIKEKLGS